MKNPIEKRLRAEALRKLAETFLGKKNFTGWAIFYSALLFIVTGWLPDGIAELIRGEWIGGAYKGGFSVLILLFIGIQLKKALRHEGKIEVITEETTAVDALAVFLSVLSMNKKNKRKISRLSKRSWALTALK